MGTVPVRLTSYLSKSDNIPLKYMIQGSQNQVKRKYMSVSSGNQPQPQCTLPENVPNPLLHIPVKVHEEFGSRSSVSVRTPRNYFSGIIFSRRLSPYQWLVVALCTLQLRVHIVLSWRSFDTHRVLRCRRSICSPVHNIHNLNAILW